MIVSKAIAGAAGLEMEYVHCPVCGTDAARELFWTEDRLFGGPGRFRVVKCGSCSLIYLNPRPTRRALAEIYPKEYPPHAPVPCGGSRPQSKRRRWMKAVAVRWYTRGLGFDPREVRETLSRVDEFPPHFTFGFFPTKPHGKLLDVGCGTGLYLHAFQRLGWEAYGVEISAAVAEETRRRLGLKVISGVLEDAKFPDGTFDVVTLIHVLEHLLDPVATLHEVCRILKSGGMALMAVPNFRSVAALIFRSRWFPLEVPRHFCQLTPDTVGAMLARVKGLEMVKVNHLPITVGFTKSWAYVCQDFPRLGRILPAWVIHRLAPPLAWAAALARVSDSIVVYARKTA